MVPAQPAGMRILGGGSHIPGARSDSGAKAEAGSASITDNSIVATDAGRSISGGGVPSGALVGQVTDTPATATASSENGGIADTRRCEWHNPRSAHITQRSAV